MSYKKELLKAVTPYHSSLNPQYWVNLLNLGMQEIYTEICSLLIYFKILNLTLQKNSFMNTIKLVS